MSRRTPDEPEERFLTDFPGLHWCGQYILGGEEGHTPIPCYSLTEWGEFLADRERVIVARTGNETKWVSTVFLGVDHRFWGGGPPTVFESMAFVDEGRTIEWGDGERMDCPTPLDCERYSSWDDAEIGHKAMVRKWLINAKTRVGTDEAS
jgi:hypothetical protein